VPQRDANFGIGTLAAHDGQQVQLEQATKSPRDKVASSPEGQKAPLVVEQRERYFRGFAMADI
jgi:hypothetical protein